MMKLTREQIKKDLTEIRYFYLMRSSFNNKVQESKEVLDLVDKYEKAIKTAPIRLQGYYIERYMNNSSAKEMADKWNRSVEFVMKLKREFLKYLLENIGKDEQ